MPDIFNQVVIRVTAVVAILVTYLSPNKREAIGNDTLLSSNASGLHHLLIPSKIVPSESFYDSRQG